MALFLNEVISLNIIAYRFFRTKFNHIYRIFRNKMTFWPSFLQNKSAVYFVYLPRSGLSEQPNGWQLSCKKLSFKFTKPDDVNFDMLFSDKNPSHKLFKVMFLMNCRKNI